MENPKEFLNPNSSLTPGYAGAMTMLITNTITTQLDLVEPWPGRIGLIISLLFSFAVIAPLAIVYWQKALYLVLNALIIFAVALGTNSAGEKIAAEQQSPSLESRFSLEEWLGLSSAHASQPPLPERQAGWCCLNGRVDRFSQEACKQWGGLFFPTQEEASQACKREKRDKDQRDDKRFFKPWF